MNSLLASPANLNSSRGFSGLTAAPIDIRFFVERGLAYSAAATANAGRLLAAETMKSLMRGTISERKREPLNTP
jgi:hypothetical protein